MNSIGHLLQTTHFLPNTQFQITARELGINKLSTTAMVTVNLIDVNDNAPKFLKEKYIFNVFENEAPGKVLLKVRPYIIGLF